MNTQEVKRKLTAILNADVKGYSRLMGEDEVATLNTLSAYFQIMTNLIQKHQGRVLNIAGDNLLADFESVVDAVQCGVEIQKELRSKNAELAEGRRVEFRIGVNLGDVIREGDTIYGDGVNIAERVQSLADAGGVCISGAAYDFVGKKLSLGYEYLGEQTVKNIEKPVRVYRVLMEPGAAGKVIGEKKAKPRQWQMATMGLVIGVIVVVAALVIWKLYTPSAPQLEVISREKVVTPQPEKAPTAVTPSTEVAPKEKVAPPTPEKVSKPAPPPVPKMEVASKEKMAFPLPDKPSIAVLPFVNMSGDPQQEFFADGMTEEIITALSKGPNLFVIARNSTFTYKGKAVKVKQVSEELGVRYVLEGSVQRSGDRIRVNAQLIDALKGHHLWAERYDRDVKDIFAIQDEITMKIITALQVKLTSGEMIHVLAKGAKNIDAFTKYLQAVDLWTRLTKETNAQAKKLLEEAIALDPEYPGPYIGLAKTYGMDVFLGTTQSPAQSMAKAFEFAQKAISLDNTNEAAYSVLSWLYATQRQYEKAIAESERAISLNSNSAESYMRLGLVLAYAGRAEEGIPYMQNALRLNPFPSPNYFSNFAMIYCESGHYEKAIEAAKRALQSEPNTPIPYTTLVISYIRLGREEEARAAAAEVRRINPKWSLAGYAKNAPFTQPQVERNIDALRKAGLK
jgi:TolB-like protein/class 3 adenylate cyclase/Tfp pilus assembly protein PilF